MAMLRGQPDSEKLDCRGNGPGWRRDPHSPQNFISAAIRQVGKNGRRISGIRYTAWLAEELRARRLEAPVLDTLLAAHCKQVPLGSACPLILREPALYAALPSTVKVCQERP
jgi:hypothetical protein